MLTPKLFLKNVTYLLHVLKFYLSLQHQNHLNAGGNSKIRYNKMNNLDYTIQKGQFNPLKKNHVRSTMTGSCSVFWKLFKQSYRKVVHVNGETVALFFYIQDSTKRWIPWTGTDYKPCDFFTFENLPNFIKRHIDAEILQDYANQRAMGNYKKYPFGLQFENGNLVNI